MKREAFPSWWIEEFWAKTDRSGSCWIWTGNTRSPRGYGTVSTHRLSIDRNWMLAHRMAVIITRGSIPAGLFVCHTCDEPRCVNPDHLFTASHQDNMADMCRKGRQARGERRPDAKLTDREVVRIFRLRAAGNTHGKIASMVGVSTSIVTEVLNRKRWRHVVVPTELELAASRALNRKYHRLSDTEVEEIRAKYTAGTTSQPRLAREYGTAVSHIGAIVRNETRVASA